MRRCISLSLVLFFTFAVLQAKPAHLRSVTGGLKLGVNMSWLPNSDEIIYSSEHALINSGRAAGGAAVGGFICLNFDKSITLQPEVLFSMQGCNYMSPRDLKINYINIPCIVRYSLEKSKMGFYLGPQFSLSVTELDSDRKIEINKFDLSLCFGADYRTKMGFLVDLRYSLGVLNVLENTMNKRVWNSVVSLSFGWEFGKSF